MHYISPNEMRGTELKHKTGILFFVCLLIGGVAFAGDLFTSLSDQDLVDITLKSKKLDLAQNSLRATGQTQVPATLSSGDKPSPLTLGAFPKILGKNFLGLFSKQNIAPFVIGMSATGVFRGAGADEEVEEYFGHRNIHTGLSDTGAEFGKPYILAPAIGGLFIAGLYSSNDRFKSFSYSLAQGIVMDGVIAIGLKQLTERERPDGSNHMSFPSGHSMDSFMIATVIDSHYGHKYGLLAYGFAGAIAASRLERNVHWLSDVAAGATFGYIIGRTASRNIYGLQLTRHVSMTPMVNPFDKSYGMGFTIHLP